jgi:hypothetical protein
VSRGVWNTIQNEGLDEEQDAPKHTDWVMATLTISPQDAQALQSFNDDAIEDFNRFDIHLKSRYPGLTDLIDYDNGTVTIVKTATKQGVAENMDHSRDSRAVEELRAALLAKKDQLQSASDDRVYDIIDKIMTRIARSHSISGQKLHDMWVDKYKQIPDTWIMNENFADGKGPGRPGDSQRHGIPKKATMAELEKASHAKGRKGQLARWQLNMRRGRKK